MVKKSLAKRGGKLTKQPAKRVKEVACKEPKPLQAKSSVKEAGKRSDPFTPIDCQSHQVTVWLGL